MRRSWGKASVVLAVAVVGGITACGSDKESSGGSSGGGDKKFVIGVSNTLVGNGWREQMICSIKAEATASGAVSKVIVVNENGGPPEQIKHIESLISQGVNAIIINPTDREKLNPAIEAAIAKGIVVVAVDQAVTAKGAYVATNDQVAYGRVGAEELFKQLGGKGNVVEMRGIDGVPADTDRHTGFTEALAKYPDIKVVGSTFTGWDPSQGATQAAELLAAQQIDGIWTSGIDYTVVEQFAATNKAPVPVIGADNNGFVKQLLDGQPGAAVTNPPAIGAVGTSIAIKALKGEKVDSVVTLTPEVFAKGADGLKKLYAADQQVGWSTYVDIKPWTSYKGSADVSACKAPGE